MRLMSAMIRSTRHRETGLTLVELMIAITLSLLIVGAVIALYLTSNHVYQVQDNLSRLQENARYAMSTMARDVRMAGYEGCLSTQGPGQIVPHNDLNNPSLYPYSFQTPVVGYQYYSGAWSPTLDSSITNALTTPPNPPGGSYQLDPNSDIITIRRADSTEAVAVTQPSGSSATLVISQPNPFYSGQILIVTNCAAADIFQVTAKPSGSAVTHNTGNTVTPGNAVSALSQNYSTDAEVMPLSTLTYFVGTYQPPGTPAPPAGPPTLWRLDTTNPGSGGTGPIPMAVAANVAQMTIYYGEDTSNSKSASEYLTEQQIQTVDPTMKNVVSVRIVLLLQTSDNNLSRNLQQIVNYPFVGAPAPATFTATDHRLYRVFTMTIALRNRIL